MTAADQCGIWGSIHLNPTVAIRPGGLSAISYSSGLDVAAKMSTVVYDPAGCPTYGVSDPITSIGAELVGDISKWTTRTYRTIGAPYNPILLPPQELLSLDPEWRNCTRNTSGEFATFSYGLFDPPGALTPVAAMGNPTTTLTQISSSTFFHLRQVLLPNLLEHGCRMYRQPLWLFLGVILQRWRAVRRTLWAQSLGPCTQARLKLVIRLPHFHHLWSRGCLVYSLQQPLRTILQSLHYPQQ